ncbi:Gfo/Idh/MocA family protein [Ruania alba]|uniref:Predicted dehydrogenase n=1 Tax=Ruania alba TaxID=648782 RepID=A0A1H5HF15_9MICO|nr:Gfo/Idh/MocA family oxidoreductase [Ruania alba]SEE26557.1 Predicted dehydrogenase [Ruania alba]
MTTTFAVVGIHGYGKQHLHQIGQLAAEGRARLVAVVDPRGTDGAAHVPPGTPAFGDLSELLAETVPDVVTFATPIHTHLPLAAQAMRAGAHVLLEKPTTASLPELRELIAVADETGKSVQVGFQSFGSHAFDRIAEITASGRIGEITGIGGIGLWRRARSYYDRSPWAGMRRLDGLEVVDGVVTNPLAHSIASALRIAGARRAEDVAEVVVDLFHANDIEADDTSAVRLRTTSGMPIALGLTLAAEEPHTTPRVFVHGTAGSIEFRYTSDVLIVRAGGGEKTEEVQRTSLFENLLDHLQHGIALLADVRDTGAFMRVLEAVRTAPDPAPIAAEHQEIVGEGPESYRVVRGVDDWCRKVSEELATFTELSAPWTAAPAAAHAPASAPQHTHGVRA